MIAKTSFLASVIGLAALTLLGACNAELDGTANTIESLEPRPGQTNVDLVSLGAGLYVGLYIADAAGGFTVDFQATSPVYKPGTASNTFTVSTTGADLLETVQATARSTEWHLDWMEEDVRHIAEDGDWFWQKIPTNWKVKVFYRRSN